MAGAELRQVQQAANAYRLYGYNSSTGTVGSVDNVNPYPDFVTGAPSYIPAGTSVNEGIDRFVSLYANASYTWKARYTVSGSARRDASNLFGVSTNNKWQPLWSAGASWALSDESFYRLSFLPRLRFRLTWGFSGNVDQSRSAVTTIGYSGRTATYTNLPFASVSQFANPSLRWEKVATLNMALDFASRQNRVSGSLEYYIKKGTDLFGSSPVDYTAVAAKTVVINVAGMKGSGLELVVNTINTNTKLKWTTALQFNYNTSRVTKYFLASTRGFDHISNGTRITAITGYPVYAVLSFAWKGLDSLGNPVGIVNKQPTTSYSSIIGTATQLPDLVYGGPATPPFFGNLSNSFSYKGFTLTAALLYKFGFYFRKESVSYDLLFNGQQGHADFANRWQNPGDEDRTYVPSMIYPNNAARDVFYSSSEVLVRRGDNIRWQFIRLGYDRHSKKQKTKGLEQWGFYLVASNLGIIWRANKDGIDPDYGTSVPPSKTIAFGITATIK